MCFNRNRWLNSVNRTENNKIREEESSGYNFVFYILETFGIFDDMKKSPSHSNWLGEKYILQAKLQDAIHFHELVNIFQYGKKNPKPNHIIFER